MSEFNHKDFEDKCDCDKHHDELFNCIRVCQKKRKFCEPSMKISDCSPKCRPHHDCCKCRCECECECKCKCKHKHEHDCHCGCKD